MRDTLGSFIVIFGSGHGVFCLVAWIVRGFRLILRVVVALTIIGCTEGGSDLYSDAAVVIIKKTSVDWVDPHERANLGIKQARPKKWFISFKQEIMVPLK